MANSVPHEKLAKLVQNHQMRFLVDAAKEMRRGKPTLHLIMRLVDEGPFAFDDGVANFPSQEGFYQLKIQSILLF